MIQKLFFISIVTLCLQGQSFAGSMQSTCYDRPGVAPPQAHPTRVLYVFIDQTMAMTMPMKDAIVQLVSEWGHNGERVKINRFSANIKGQFSELVFDEIGNINPSEEYLFHLRLKDKKAILSCLENNKDAFHDKLVNTLRNTLKLTDDKLPQTNLLHSLYNFAEHMKLDDDIKDKTVLVVSDGLEHSDVFSFHSRGVVKTINAKQAIDKVRWQQLVPNWHNAKIYFFGLGFISDEKFYARPKVIEPLKKFWRTYFLDGSGVLNTDSFGTPMLLTKSIL